MFEQDWIIRQIRNIVRFLVEAVLKKKSSTYEMNQVNHKDEDLLHNRLEELLSKRKICEAEDLLFESMNKSDIQYLEVAVDFYAKLNRLDDKTLEDCNFSRSEIEQGLRDAALAFGISLP